MHYAIIGVMMRRLLIIVQFIVLAVLLFLILLLMFYDFGKPRETTLALSVPEVSGTVTNLEQMRSWSDLIVERTVFSPQRGKAEAGGSEAWTKEGPPFVLTAIFKDNSGGSAVFIPSGADPALTQGSVLRVGGALMDKVTLVEIKDTSVIVRKPDGLFEMHLSRTVGKDQLKFTPVEKKQ